MILIGVVFAAAAGTLDPGQACDAGGRDCVPWLVPLALALGTVSAAVGAWRLARNHGWGCRVDVPNRRLVWWDSRIAKAEQSVDIDDIASVRVEPWADGGDRIHFFRRDGTRLDIPSQEVIPYEYDAWSMGLAAVFPSIRVDIGPSRRRPSA